MSRRRRSDFGAVHNGGGTPDVARAFLACETERLEPVIRKANITAE